MNYLINTRIQFLFIFNKFKVLKGIKIVKYFIFVCIDKVNIQMYLDLNNNSFI